MIGRLGVLRLIAVLCCAAMLGACTGPMPLYGASGTSDAAAYAFSYGRPANRSDQIIYRELRLRLPPRTGTALEAVTVAVSSHTYARSFVRTNIGTPTAPYEMVAVANVTVTRADGTPLFSGQRTASAAYTYASQVLADKQAEIDAAERASVAVAESVRLAILAALARG